MNKLLIDISQQLFASTYALQNEEITEDLLRHVSLNTLRNIVKTHKKDYPEVIIAYDDTNYWRKDIHPFYKGFRSYKNSNLDMQLIFNIFNKIKNELKVYLPYKIIHVERAESDDIIGVLTKIFSVDSKVLIISSDKDFFQLHNFNVKQYSPIVGAFITTDGPDRELKIKILKGEGKPKDAIPNVLSPLDTFFTGVRQKTMSNKRLEHFLESDMDHYEDEFIRERWKTNKRLVDFNYIPMDIQDEIMRQYSENKVPKKDQLLNYCVKYDLNKIVEILNDF